MRPSFLARSGLGKNTYGDWAAQDPNKAYGNSQSVFCAGEMKASVVKVTDYRRAFLAAVQVAEAPIMIVAPARAGLIPAVNKRSQLSDLGTCAI